METVYTLPITGTFLAAAGNRTTIFWFFSS